MVWPIYDPVGDDFLLARRLDYGGSMSSSPSLLCMFTYSIDSMFNCDQLPLYLNLTVVRTKTSEIKDNSLSLNSNCI